MNQKKTQQQFTIQPMSMKEAISRAIKREDSEFKRTHWASHTHHPTTKKTGSNKQGETN